MAVDFVHDCGGRDSLVRRFPVEPHSAVGIAAQPKKPGFGELVAEFAREVNSMQLQAGQAVEMLATGQAADVHQVMIAVSQAGIALDLMLEIRNRVLEGYQELMRMQV